MGSEAAEDRAGDTQAEEGSSGSLRPVTHPVVTKAEQYSRSVTRLPSGAPSAMGHSFDEHLLCSHCRWPWEWHQTMPEACGGRRQRGWNV
jgi:hypothetical protein